MVSPGVSKKWYVFYTYPKFERKVHECLQKMSHESFLPLHWVERQWSDRIKRLQEPLFPNYIFVNIERNKIFEILELPKIIRCVTFNKIPAFLRQNEVNNIQQIINEEYTFQVYPTLEIGRAVLIKKGPLMGMKGVLIEERGKHRFAVKLESLQQSVIVNIPASYLEFTEDMSEVGSCHILL